MNHTMKKFSYTIFLIFFASFLSAQEVIIITGYVKDAETLRPLPSATVSLPLGRQGKTADYNGYFEIIVPANTQKLIFSYVGYKQQAILLKGKREFIEVLLETSIFQPVTVRPLPVEYPNYFPQGRSVYGLTADELQANNETSIAPALNKVPGVFMHTGALNTNRITIRGIGARSLFSTTKMRAYLNDIPLTTGDGETTIEDIDLNILKSVNVFKGPTTSMYGAGLGGTMVLNRVRKGAQNEIGTKATFGSYGLQRYTNQISIYKKRFALSLFHNKTKSDGYRDNNAYNRQSFTGIGEVQFTNSNLTLFANYIDLKAFIPSSLDSANYVNNPQAAAFTWGQAMGNEDYNRGMFGANYRQRFSNWGALSTSVFSSFKNNYEVRPFGILDENALNYGFRSMLAIDMNNMVEIRAGIEGFKEDYDWKTYELTNNTQGALESDNSEIRNYLNLFAESTVEIDEQLTATLGINFNQTNYSYQDFFNTDSTNLSGDYSFDWTVSPRVALRYEPDFIDWEFETAIFANASHGFSPPSLEETLTPDGAINPNIQPEKGWNYEVGLDGRLFERFFYKVALYSLQVKDLLVARRTDNDRYIGINAGETVHNGIEASMNTKWEIDRDFTMKLKTTYHFADYKFKDFIDDTNDYSGNQLTGIPRHTFNADLENYHNNFYPLKLLINYQFVGTMPMRDDNSIYSDAYHLLNLKLDFEKTVQISRRNKKRKNLNYNVYFGLNNVLNEKYASMILINASSFGGRPPRYYYPGLPLNWYGGVSLRLIL